MYQDCSTLFHKKFFFLFCILVAIAIYILFKIVEYPVFFFSDQHELFRIMGGMTGVFNYPVGVGRFFPFCKIEFYPILTSGLALEHIMLGIYLVQALKVAIFFVFCFLTFQEIGNYKVALFLSFTFLGFGHFVSLYNTFASTIFPETCLLTALSIFSFAYIKAVKTDKTAFFCIAFFSAVFATYLKEPIFAVLITLAFIELVLRYKELSLKRKTFLYALILNGILFLVLYFVLAYGTGNYAEGRTDTSTIALIRGICKTTLFIPFALSILVIRIVQYLFFKSKINLADIFLCMSAVYITCFIYLKLNATYYFLPAYFFFFASIAGYIATAPFDMLCTSLTKKFSMLTQAQIKSCCTYSILLLSLFCVYKGVNICNFEVTNKIYSKALTEALLKCKQKGFPYVAYLPDVNSFEHPFLHTQAHWYLYTLNMFYNAAQQQFGLLDIPSYSQPQDFLNKLDHGHPGQFAPFPTKAPFPWSNNPHYHELDFGFTSFVYNVQYELQMKEIYCSFAQSIASQSKKSFQKNFANIYRDAARLGCIVQP